MPCEIQIKNNIEDQVRSLLPYNYNNLARSVLINHELRINNIIGANVLKFEKYQDDTYVADINIPKSLINEIYDKQLIVEVTEERRKMDEGTFQNFNEEGDLYYQEGATGKSDEVLDNKIRIFLNSIGVTTVNVDALYDSQGNKLSATAVADMFNKIIKVVNGKAGINTLPEEASHFFVEMIEGTPMLENMLNKVVNYPEYKEVVESEFYQKQYKGDVRKLKKEAIGKVITSYILKNNKADNEKDGNFINKWWNALWDKISAMFGRVTTNPFEESAKSILGNKIEGTISSTESYYQEDTNNKQNKLINALDNKYNLRYNPTEENTKTKKLGIYELVSSEGLKKIYNRVSDRVEKAMSKKGFSERTEKEKQADKARQEFGIKGHTDINNILSRIIEDLNGNVVTKRVVTTDEVAYNMLESYFKEFIGTFPPGTKFYTEKIVYDELNNEAGTIDFLAVTPEGKVEVFDWKFVEFKQKDTSGKVISKSVPWYKEEAYNIQISRYRQILRTNYGVEPSDFRRSRIIPINVTYKGNTPQSIEIGNKTINGEDKSYLDPVPISSIAGGEAELTGDKKIDDLIKVLIEQRKRILDKVEITPEAKLKKAERLERINDSIKALQIKGDIKAFLNDSIYELNYIKNKGINNLTDEELNRAYELTDYYSNILKDKVLPKEQETLYTSELSRLVTNAGYLYGEIKEELETRIKKIALDRGINDVQELQIEVGWWSKTMRTISQNNHPIVKTFYKLVSQQKDKVHKDLQQLNSNIEDKLSKLQEWGRSRGLTGKDVFKPILGKDANGNYTGNLITLWDKKYFELRDTAIAAKNTEWLQSNTIFDEDAYNKVLAKNIEIWKDLYAYDEDGQKKYEKKVSEFITKHNPTVSALAYYNKKNRFISPKNVWKSKEWLELQKPENAPLKEFYDLFTDTIKEFRDFLPLDINGNFIPNIKNDLMDQIVQNGLGSIKGLGRSIVQHLEAGSDSTVGMIDSITGERIKTIPLFYIDKIDANTKSYDLGKVLSIFADTAYNYKYMAEIESSAKMLREALASRKQILTTNRGDIAKSKLDGHAAEVIGTSKTLELFDDYMNYYLYGISLKDKDKVIKAGNKEISAQKTFSKALQFFSAKSLVGNLVSGAANLGGGGMNVYFEAIKNRFFSSADMAKGSALMATKDKTAHALMEYFDIDSTETAFKKANNLSVSFVTKNLTLDKAYFLQRGPDYVIENGVLLAMLNSHTIKDGKIVKKNKEDKSLYELTNIINDKLNIEGLSEQEYYKFRRKVKYLYSTIKGNTNSDDINTVKLTMMGQALMQFRNWIPKMADERFGNLRYTEDLDTWELGKYQSFVGQLGTKTLPNLFNSLMSAGVLGIGATSINSKAIENRAKELYLKEKDKNPNITITEEQFIQMHKANIKSTALEIQLILAFMGLLALLKPDGDDDKDPTRMAFIKIINRNLDEIAFFIDPTSFQSILKKPIPIVGLATDTYNLVSDFAGEITGQIIGDKEMIKRNKPIRRFNKIFPGTNTLENWWSLSDPDYNKNK